MNVPAGRPHVPHAHAAACGTCIRMQVGQAHPQRQSAEKQPCFGSLVTGPSRAQVANMSFQFTERQVRPPGR